MIKVGKARLVELAEAEGIDVRTDYSGRAMYGRNCVGVVGVPHDMLRFVLAVVPGLDPDDTEHTFAYAEEWLAMAMDNMGYDTIFYWPNVQAMTCMCGDLDCQLVGEAPDGSKHGWEE